MASSRKDKLKCASQEIPQPIPQRQSNVLLRISSGISSSVLSGISSLKKPLPRNRSSTRPKSEPNYDHPITFKVLKKSRRKEDEERLLPPRIEFPILTEPLCPYDPDSYHSFPTYREDRKKQNVHSCGLPCPRPFSREVKKEVRQEVSKEPCRACKMRLPDSHLARAQQQLRDQKTVDTAYDKHMKDMPESSEDPLPRVVAQHIAATRISNPARKARMPSDVDLSKVLWKQEDYKKGDEGQPLTRRGDIPVHEREETEDGKSTFGSIKKRLSPSSPSNPRLHYIYGLPNAKKYPYVRKKDFRQYVIDKREGRESPLDRHLAEFAARPHTAASSAPGRLKHSSGIEVHDFSNTVWYPRGASPLPIVRSSLEPTISDDDAEDRKGNVPQLRGGSGGERKLKLKTCFLTCGSERWKKRVKEDAIDMNSDDYLPAPKPVSSRTGYKTPIRVPLPKRLTTIWMRKAKELKSKQEEADGIGATFLASTPRLSNTINKEIVNPSQKPAFREAKVNKIQPVLYLRGGGSSNTLPKTLFWLAGGKGKPITVAQWNKQKPNKRMGGLLGMAVYGHKAGTKHNASTQSRASPSIERGESSSSSSARGSKSSTNSSKKNSSCASKRSGRSSGANKVVADENDTTQAQKRATDEAALSHESSVDTTTGSPRARNEEATRDIPGANPQTDNDSGDSTQENGAETVAERAEGNVGAQGDQDSA